MATGEHPAPAGYDPILPAPPPGGGGLNGPACDPGQAKGPDLIPLPPLPRRPAVAPEAHRSLLRRIGLLETLLLVLVLVFAFLVASFPASNSDLLLSLATGRLIATGGHQFGSDPFTFTAQGQWINHHWLFDLVVFSLWRLSAVGGIVLVVLKALAVALLGWLMVQTGSLPGRPRWLPLSCSVLALLAVSRGLHLQPIVGSFLLLAITLFLLVRVGATSRWIWLLPLLCGLWVNLDEWFFLGPLTIALFLLGEFLQRQVADSAEQSGSLKTLALVLAASVLACLVNPYHIAAFRLPPVLDPTIAGGAAAHDPLFRGLFLSPLEGVWFRPDVGLSAAGMAWFPLVILGMASFALAFPSGKPEDKSIGWRWWRVLVWLAFVALSAWNARAIPFFAVVAAPITALNLLDFSARQYGQTIPLSRPWRRWGVGGRVLTLLAVVLLGAATVPGWLQAQPHSPRRLGWGVAIDPTLEHAARQVARWNKDRLLTGEEKWFNLSSDVVHYFAWFCADENGRPLARFFLDQRLHLFRGSVDDFAAVGRSLSGTAPEDKEQPVSYRAVFGRYGVRYFVFHGRDLGALAPVLERLYASPDEWQPCFVEGRAALFAWRDPGSSPRRPFDERLAFDFDQAAFGPDARPAPDTRAPAAGERPWWEPAFAPRTSSPDVDTAVQLSTRFDALGPYYHARIARSGQTILATRVVATALGPGGPVLNGMLLPLRLDLALMPLDPKARGMLIALDQYVMAWLGQYAGMQDRGPPSSLYLAIRAARRALHEDPADPRPYLLLAEAYTRLSRNTRERSSIRAPDATVLMPQIELIRQSQAAAALQSLLAMEPRPEVTQAAHRLLAETLKGGAFAEVQMKHYREYLRLSRLLGSMPGVAPSQFREALDREETASRPWERDLKTHIDRYEIDSARAPLLQKALIAIEHGLAETAISLLRSAEPKDLADKSLPGESPGLAQLVELLLGMGRLDEARTILTAPADADGTIDKRLFGWRMGMPGYEWFSFRLAAASGDYEAADAALDDAIDLMECGQDFAPTLVRLDLLPPRGKAKVESPAAAAALVVGHFLLSRPGSGLMQGMHTIHRTQGIEAIRVILEQQADLWTLRAWLALEHGRIDRVKQYAGKALTLAGAPPGDSLGEAAQTRRAFRCEGLARLCLKRITPRAPSDDR